MVIVLATSHKSFGALVTMVTGVAMAKIVGSEATDTIPTTTATIAAIEIHALGGTAV